MAAAEKPEELPLPTEEPEHEKPKTPAPATEALPARAVLGDLKVTSVSPSSVQLQWSVPEGPFDSFMLQYRDAQGQPQALPIDGESRSVTVPGLSPSHRYRFHLYGLRGRKKIDHVSTEAMTGKGEGQGKEGRVDVVTPSSVQLQWSVPEGSFDSFMLQYRDAHGQPQALPIAGGSRSVTVLGLSPSHRYRFHRYGMHRGKIINHVSSDIITCEREIQRNEGMRDRWRDGEAETSRGLMNDGWIAVMDSGHTHHCPLCIAATDKTEEPPSPSEEPQTEALPTDNNQPEHTQNEVPLVRAVLGELRVTSVTPDSVQLQWSVPEAPFDSFMLQYRDAQGQPQALPIDGGSRSVTVPGLSPSRRYRFHLYGLRDGKRTDRVSTDIVTAAAKPEELPLPSEEPKPEVISSDAPPAWAELGELKVSSVTPDSVQLQWSVPKGPFDSFMLQYRDVHGEPQALPIDGRSRSVTVPGLSPSHQYRFHLYGLQGGKRVDHVSTDVVTDAAVPEMMPIPSVEPQLEDHKPEQPQTEVDQGQVALGKLRVTNVTPNSVQLQWSISEGSFDSFTLQYRDALGQPQALAVDGGSRSVTVPGLSPSHWYRFHLYGVRGRKRIDRVSTDVVTADPEDLPPPSMDTPTEATPSETPSARAVLGELKVSSVTPNSVQLHWTVPEGHFDSFMLQYRDAQGQPQALPINSRLRSVTVPGLSPSHRYRFHLYGLRARKKIDHVSTEIVIADREAATVLEELPLPSEEPQDEKHQTEVPTSAPTLAQAVLKELTVSSVTPSSVQLQWSVPKGSFDSFMLQYRDVHGQPQALPIDGGSRSVTVPGLSPSHRYRFHLYGLRGRKKIAHVSTDIVTATTKPEELSLPSEEPHPEDPKGKDPPTEATPSEVPLERAVLSDLRVSNITPDSVQLQWSVPKGSFDSFMLQYRDAEGQPQALPIDGGSRSVTVPGLSPSRRYRFHLYGLQDGKRIDHVSTETTTGAPGTLWVGSVWPRSAWLHWDAPHTPPDGYELMYGPPGGPQQTLWLPPEATSRQLWGLEPARRYGVRLWGRGGDPQTAPLEATFDTREWGELEGVFQRRQDGGTDFWRGWDSYARGFGNVSGEFWLGNEALHELTTATPTELRVDLRTARDSAFALYRDFAVGSAQERYRLRVGAFSGTAGDALSYHSGSPFSTKDRDSRDPRDRRDPSGRPHPPPCAVAYGGAWWYRNCHYANLNGRYGTPRDHQGIHWFPWKGFNVSIPFTEMKLRPQRG
ncbi:tenascin-X-like [Parus major]|uniref:tenascin-X-like n=1 Tax=Parus major TaxID=9157 RepID=UPI0007715B4C|nr:tenascin-X-like [Parus major]